MTLKDEFAALTGRIAKARADLAAWQAAGAQEKYLEAYSLVDALELQLAQLRQAGLAVNEHAGLPERVEALNGSQGELMASLDISFVEGMYHFGPYRYDRLSDAVSSARLRRASGQV